MFHLVAFQVYAIAKIVYYFNLLSWTSTGSSHRGVPWNQLKVRKNWNFIISWVHWMKQCRSIIRKHALLWNNHEYQHSALTYLLKTSLTHFMALVTFSTPWNTENQRFFNAFREHRKRPLSWNVLIFLTHSMTLVSF